MFRIKQFKTAWEMPGNSGTADRKADAIAGNVERLLAVCTGFSIRMAKVGCFPALCLPY